MRKNKKLKSFVGFGIITGLILLFIYCIFASNIRKMSAQNYYQLLKEKSYHIVDDIVDAQVIETAAGSESEVSQPIYKRPGYSEYTMLKLLSEISETTHVTEYEIPIGTAENTNPEQIEIETAAVFQDSAGNVLFKSGDYIFFPYTTEEDWKKGQEGTTGYAYVDLNSVSEELRDWFSTYWISNQEDENNQIRKLCITGMIENQMIIPSRIDIITQEQLDNSFITLNQLNQTDLEGSIGWETIYNTSNHSSDEVILYATDPTVTFYPQDNDMLSSLEKKQYGDFNDRRDLTSLVYYSNRFVEIGEDTFDLVHAVSSSPESIAENELVYIFNWARMLLIAAWLIINIIAYVKLIRPVRLVNKAFDEGYTYIWKDKEGKGLWEEQYELIAHYLDVRNGNFKHRNETEQLKDALSNSSEAQVKQKKKVNNLAHDLKNPMSIIYTYSEALKENISEEKNEEYFEVILSEIKHMENMVVDMLDLSREKEV